MDGVAILIKQTIAKDALNQYVPSSDSEREIFVEEKSITRSEWATAGKNGYNPDILLTTARVNYCGESEVKYNGTRYSIYRTYCPPNSDDIELYLEKKAGVQNG